MNNFTPRAQQVLALARTEADRLKHNYIGTEHLLLGLIKLGQGTGFKVLFEIIKLDQEAVPSEIERQLGSCLEKRTVGNIPYTPRVKKVLALASKEARLLSHSYVGTEHIVLGIISEGEGVSARVLRKFGVNIEQVRKEVLKELGDSLGPSLDQVVPIKLIKPEPGTILINPKWVPRLSGHTIG